jgi:hypothetical protein
MDELDSEWQRKGATLSDKTARKEFSKGLPKLTLRPHRGRDQLANHEAMQSDAQL